MQSKAKSALQIIAGGHVVAAGIATAIGNETWYRSFLMPCLQLFGAETAHWVAVKAAKYKLVPAVVKEDLAVLVR